jgi:formate hydrogenlyase subunit 3/multisubunit Na+/H+ antiporter MnhD subunit
VALLPSSDWAVVALAAMGFFGALFHTLNHGLFKGLLFLNSGAMLWATGTQDLNRLGGLMKLMPCTAVTALVASFAISGVPLFNGFASKWSILVAAIGGASAAKYLAVCAVVAVVTSALTLASFIKFFGASFLSRRSALVAAKAQGCRSLEVGGAMRASQVFLAVLCVGLGLMPAVAVHMVGRALESNPQGLAHVLAKAMPFASGLGGGIACVENQALWVPLVVALVLGLMWLMASGLARLGQAPHRLAVPWLCGYVSEADPHRYVAHNFYAELKRYFHWLGGSPPPPPVQKPPSKE